LSGARIAGAFGEVAIFGGRESKGGRGGVSWRACEWARQKGPQMEPTKDCFALQLLNIAALIQEIFGQKNLFWNVRLPMGWG